MVDDRFALISASKLLERLFKFFFFFFVIFCAVLFYYYFRGAFYKRIVLIFVLFRK